jgi:pyruvate dehydrogenase E2 component (dihydrolipoamide acetyltransferase)
MLYEFRLPDIGEGVAEGEVVRWLVKEGDVLHEDQPMVEIMTDKATVEISTPRAGRVARRCFSEGQVCPVGKVLVEIETEAGGAERRAKPAASGGSTGKAAAPAAPAAAVERDAGGSVLATPATRKLARDLGVDIRAVTGTGPAGRVTSDDVKAHQGGEATAVRLPASRSSGTDVRIPFRGVRKKIAENLVRSKHTAAHYTYVEEIDCTDLVRLRARANERLAARGGAKVSFLPFIARATAAALGRFPQLNASLDEAAGEIVQWGHIHLGLATATEAGLIVPVVRNAERLSVAELGREIDRLAAVTRSGKAAREELSGSTFTITSLGALGGVMATPIINHPEVAILGVHRILRRPAVIGEGIAIRDLMNLSISVDHRVVDGYDAARFVADIKAALEAPTSLAPELV